MVMISSIIYCIIFLGVYAWAQISTRCKEFLSKNINSINSCIFLLYFILRAVSDSLLYFAVEKNNKDENDSSFALIANFIQSLFSRTKWFLLYYLVSLAENARIKIKYKEKLEFDIENKKWGRQKKLFFILYLIATVVIASSAVLYFT